VVIWAGSVLKWGTISRFIWTALAATAGYTDKAMRDFLIARDAAIADVVDYTPRAASFFVDPIGEVISDVQQEEEGIAYAELDLSRTVEPKQFHDGVGYYNRSDIFGNTVRVIWLCSVSSR
jgi:nitrilase